MSGRLYYLVIAAMTLAAFAGMGAGSARAQTITETQRLDFGEWVVTSNAANYFVLINANGTRNNSPEMVELRPAQVGEYQVEGLPAFAVISSVSVVMTQPMSGPPGQNFTMDNFTTIAPNADFNGDTTITLGARAVTSGNTGPYGDGLFTGELTLEINL